MNGDEDGMKGIIAPAVAVAMLAGSLIALFTVVASRAQSPFSGQEHGTPGLPTFFADDSTVVPGGEADVTYRIDGTDGNVASLAVQIDFDSERVLTLGTCAFGPRQGQPCEYQAECGVQGEGERFIAGIVRCWL